MYAGHAAIALLLKCRRPDVPILPLALACYGPDFVDILLISREPKAGMGVYSHSIPAVLIGAMIAGGLFALFARRPGGMTIAFGWLVHWPADALTGLKPVFFDPSVSVGLDLYHLPFADAGMEIGVILLACWLYARTFAHDSYGRRVVIGLAAALIVAQVAVGFVQSRVDQNSWRPGLTVAPQHPQIFNFRSVGD